MQNNLKRSEGSFTEPLDNASSKNGYYQGRRKRGKCPYGLFGQILLTLLLWFHRADSTNRPGGDPVHGVQRGTGAGKG